MALARAETSGGREIRVADVRCDLAFGFPRGISATAGAGIKSLYQCLNDAGKKASPQSGRWQVGMHCWQQIFLKDQMAP
jgi:hypothetical protein